MLPPPGGPELDELVERLPRAFQAPAERSTEIRRRQLARRSEHRRREQAGARPPSPARRDVEAAGEHVDGDRSPALPLLDDAGVREHERALEDDDRGVDLLLVGADERPQLGPGAGPFGERRLGDLELQRRELAVAEVLRPSRCGRSARRAVPAPRRDERAPAPEVLAGAGEPLLGQLVLPGPALRHLGREDWRPVSSTVAQSTSREPEIASQSDGSTSSAPGRSAAIPTRSIQAAAART